MNENELKKYIKEAKTNTEKKRKSSNQPKIEHKLISDDEWMNEKEMKCTQLNEKKRKWRQMNEKETREKYLGNRFNTP